MRFGLERSWELKNWCFWTVVLEKTQESPGLQEIKPMHPKGNQSWIFIGRTDAEAETTILCPPHANSWLLEENLMLGKTEGRRKRGYQRMRWMTGWHQPLKGHEFEQVLGDGDGQGSLVCCSPWGCKESDMTEWLNCTGQKIRALPRWKVVTICWPQAHRTQNPWNWKVDDSDSWKITLLPLHNQS